MNTEDQQLALLFAFPEVNTAEQAVELFRGEVAFLGRQSGGSFGKPYRQWRTKLDALMGGSRERDKALRILRQIYKQEGGK